VEPSSLLAFYSLSEKVELLDKDLEREFFSWFRDDFTRLRPGYLYNSCDPRNLQLKYQLLIANLKKHGRVIEDQKLKAAREEKEQLSTLPEDLLPHVFFSASEDIQKGEGLKAVQIRDFIKEGERNREFDLLTMVYGLQISKKDLVEKIAELGKVWKAASRFFRKTKPLKVEIFDPYFDQTFLTKLLDEKIENTKYLRFALHLGDMSFVNEIEKNLKKRGEKEPFTRLTGKDLKDLCAVEAKNMLYDVYKRLGTSRIPSPSKPDPDPKKFWQFSDRLQIYVWQPRRPGFTAKEYGDIAKNSFHRRFIVIDGKYHLRADHSFHVPRHSSISYDEPVDISLKAQEDFKEWSNRRDFDPLRLLISGGNFFHDD